MTPAVPLYNIHAGTGDKFDRSWAAAGRQEILSRHIKRQGLPLGDDVTVESIAGSTTGFTGADLANLVNEAALLAGRSDKGTALVMCLLAVYVSHFVSRICHVANLVNEAALLAGRSDKGTAL